MDNELWIVMGNLGWGRATNFKDAFGNWMKNQSRSFKAKSVNVHRFEGDFDPAQVTVDGMGYLSFPTAAKHTVLEEFPITEAMNTAFDAWSDLCEEIRYGEAFDRAFDA